MFSAIRIICRITLHFTPTEFNDIGVPTYKHFNPNGFWQSFSHIAYEADVANAGLF
jgi:hypothetical protein